MRYAKSATHFSVAQFKAAYAIRNGGTTYSACALARLHVLKTAALPAPANGRCRFALRE